ncbi:MAG: DNA translocase FtsK [bacterium]
MAKKSKNKNKEYERHREILGIMIMAFALLIFIGLVSYNPGDYPNSGSKANVTNWLGLAGAWISHYIFVYTIGYSSLVFPLLFFLIGWNLFLQKAFKPVLRASLYLVVLGLFFSTVLALPHALSDHGSSLGFRLSGNLGGFFADQLSRYLGTAGSIIVLLTVLLLFLISATSWSMRESVLGFKIDLSPVMKKGGSFIKNIFIKRTSFTSKKPQKTAKNSDMINSPERRVETGLEQENSDTISGPIKKETTRQPQAAEPVPEKGTNKEECKIKETAPTGPYIKPSLELLNTYEKLVHEYDTKQLKERALFLEQRLKEFDIDCKVIDIKPGPVITRFEVKPAPGVKINSFVSRQDDLALVLQATPVRVVAPIPGKPAVGIEVPNRKPEMVSIRSIIESEVFQKSTSLLTLALGKSITGRPVITDLQELPHLLVAGATGSGKSVCLNAFINSILYRCHPDDVKLVLIDPKRLELSVYKRLKKHHLTSCDNMNEDVITIVDNAVEVLQSLKKEMENRYKLLAKNGVRDINDYNKLIASKKNVKDEENGSLKKIPQIVLIVDELADLMMTGAGEIEEPIAKLAQMARAVGIHLILATQRPSVDVITGIIKANFPARIAFKVSSKTDSRTILDRNGAEKLLGRGDMLYSHPRKSEPIRIHGAFVSTEEVKRVVDHISTQPHAAPYNLKESAADKRKSFIYSGEERDELFRDAARLVIRHQQGSASLLQRRLRIGYARAGRLIDELEACGIVGPFDGSKAREVLVGEDYLDKLDDPEFPDNIT